MGFFDNIHEPVPIDQLQELSDRRRAAWAAFCVGRVVERYSPYFRKTYRQTEFTDLAWRWACEEADESELPANLEEIYEELYGQAEDDGYSGGAVDPGVFVLAGVTQPDGVRLSRAVDSAAWAFAMQQLWVQGTRVNSALPDGYWEEFEWRLFRMSRVAYNVVRRAKGRITPATFAKVPLDVSFEPLPRATIRQGRIKPPAREQRFLRTLLKASR